MNFLAFGSVAHGLIAFETVLQGEHQAGLFIRFLCVHFLFVFVGCVKMTILGFASKVRQNGQKPNAEDEGAGSVLKYMINSDSHEADWLL